MNPESTVEYNSLSWVKKQLDAVLSDAQTSLGDYIETREDAQLQQCVEHLKLVFGTLQMVEVYGAAMLAEEMQQTASALLEGRVERIEDAYDVLMRAMLQLPDYLESIQAGAKDTPIVLISLINDLRAARSDSLLSESVLFVADTEDIDLSTEEYKSGDIEAGKLQAEVKRLRTHFQIGLLDIIRNQNESAGLQRIKAVLLALEKVSHNDETRHLWMVAGALADGLLHEGIDNNISIKMLLGATDRQLKKILDTDEETFAREYSRDLLKNMLYYVGTCKTDSKRIQAVKKAYKLDEFMPDESKPGSASIGGLNADLFETVSRGITEDLFQVKDALEIFMHNEQQNVEQLKPVSDQLGKIGDTFGMLGMGSTRQGVVEQKNIIDSIIRGDETISEPLILGVASELLSAESELKAFIDNRGGHVSETDDGEQTVPSSEYRQVILTVVAEALKNFASAKEALLSYLSGIGDKEQLDLITDKLEEVRGVALMLPLGRVESQIDSLKRYVRVALHNNDRQADSTEQDTVADVVTAIEYYLEALAEGRPGVEQGLDTGDLAANTLAEICLQYADSNDAETVDIAEIEPQSDEIAKDSQPPEFDADISDEAQVAQTIPDQGVDENEAPTEGEQQEELAYKILGEDADDEIVEIFIEEAVEVLGEMHEKFPQWRTNNEDEDALASIRRNFHTLKGSGRLIGAELIGEFSWKFENMLNRVIDRKISVSNDLFNAIEESLTVIPQLIEQLKGNREPISNIHELMYKADALAEGKDLSASDSADTDELNQSSDTTTVTEMVGVEDSVEEQIDIQELEDNDVSEVVESTATSNVIDISNLISTAEISGDDSKGNTLEELDVTEDEVTEDELTEDIEPVADLPEETEDRIDSPDAAAYTEETAEDEIELIDLDGNIDIEELTFDSSSEDGHKEDEADELKDAPAEDDNKALDLVLEDVNDELSIEDNAGTDDIELIDLQDEVEETSDIETLSDELNQFNEEISIDHSEIVDTPEDEAGNQYIVEIDEDGSLTEDSKEMDIDPMLLKIYYDESCGHLDNVRELLQKHRSGEEKLKADKNLNRAFHTLYGSARTAEVAAIADISGAAEKYLKARQEGGEALLDEPVVALFEEIAAALGTMLASVENGQLPENNKPLLDKINRTLQQEMQQQLQKSVNDDSLDEESITAIDVHEEESAGDTEDESTESGAVTDSSSSDVQEAPSSLAEESVVLYGDIDDELIDIFLEEAEELLENCEKTLQALKDTPNSAEHIQKLQRNMHTLKGGARMAELVPVGDLTHILESLIVLVSEQKLDVDKDLIGLLQESVDALVSMMGAVKQRKQLNPVGPLINRIEMLMRGEIEEKRSLERFDLDLTDLDTMEVETPEINDSRADADSTSTELNAHVPQASEKPHWGERATDVNFVESQELVRVRSDLLNNLVNYAGEVNIYHARLGKQVSDFSFNLSELSQTVERLKEQLRKLEIETEIQIRSGYEKEADEYDEGFDPLEMDRYSTLQQLSRSLMETAGDVESINGILSDITRDSETLLLQESRVSTDLQEGLMRTRMVRFGGLSSRMRRIVRQVSRELDKEVDLKIIGETSEVDRTVLDRIVAPLEHMLRNAVAHGIELPEQRRKAGKSETGTITITVARQGTDVIINVKDDGRGIDVERIRKKIIEQGMAEKDKKLSDYEALQYILHSGFSTADEVTQVSGRGVGMDVVDSEIKQLGGVLEINTVKGRSTEFNIRLPLTLAINQALLVSTGEDVYAVPLASIEGVVRVTGLELQRFYDSDHSYYSFNGMEYELKHLGAMLTGNQPDYSKQLKLFPVLLIKVGEQNFALHVDDLIGRREIVVKPVGMQVGAVRGIAGATILADGRVVLILELSALIATESLFNVHERIAAISDQVEIRPKERLSIMVVDDSITIRKVTERILGRNGFDVILAKDGVDATNKMQDHIPDLMLLDIEMPRMDGFEVATYVRNDNRLKDLPIIMITSRTGSKHKEKAMEIGVNQYLGKPYQEEELMTNINALLNTAS